MAATLMFSLISALLVDDREVYREAHHIAAPPTQDNVAPGITVDAGRELRYFELDDVAKDGANEAGQTEYVARYREVGSPVDGAREIQARLPAARARHAINAQGGTFGRSTPATSPGRVDGRASAGAGEPPRAWRELAERAGATAAAEDQAAALRAKDDEIAQLRAQLADANAKAPSPSGGTPPQS